MNYIVLETQTNDDGTIGTIVMTYADESEAQSNYHKVLSFAAVSKLPKHAVFLLTDDGIVIESRVYYHKQEEEVLPDEATTD